MNREASREWTAELYRRFLPGEPDAYDTFLRLVGSACPEGGTVVDLGCGDESYLTFLAQKAGEIIGIDDRELRGPYTRYVRTDLNRRIPLRQGSVDVAACKFLVEHLVDPASFLRQVRSSLRPGGRLVVMTPNILYYPYALNYLLARFVSQERRMRLVELFSGRPPQDIFPVHYRCNTPRRLRRELVKAGFDVMHLETYGDCCASAVTRPLGALAVAYEKAAATLGAHGMRGFIVAAAAGR